MGVETNHRDCLVIDSTVVTIAKGQCPQAAFVLIGTEVS